MPLSYKQQRQKDKCIQKLNKIKKFELINRLLCYACVLPFFHAAACLGQDKNIPLASKLGSIGFCCSVAGAFISATKREKTEEKLIQLTQKEKNSHHFS